MNEDSGFSIPFRQALFLISGLSYMYLAILILITNAEKLSDSPKHLVFTDPLNYLALQATWILYFCRSQTFNLRACLRTTFLTTCQLLTVYQVQLLFFITPIMTDFLRYINYFDTFMSDLVPQSVFPSMLFPTYLMSIQGLSLASFGDYAGDSNLRSTTTSLVVLLRTHNWNYPTCTTCSNTSG